MEEPFETESEGGWERLRTMLHERGVDKVDLLLREATCDLDGALGAIKWWDDLPRERAGTGLLVNKLRDGGLPGYKRPHERTTPQGVMDYTDEDVTRLRGQLLSPDGFTRPEAEEWVARRAKRLNTSAAALIDSAVGAAWTRTPVHPAKWDPSAEPDSNGVDRYSAWVRGHCSGRPDLSENPEHYESEWDFACAFWRWTDPEPREPVLMGAEEEEAPW